MESQETYIVMKQKLFHLLFSIIWNYLNKWSNILFNSFVILHIFSNISIYFAQSIIKFRKDNENITEGMTMLGMFLCKERVMLLHVIAIRITRQNE